MVDTSKMTREELEFYLKLLKEDKIRKARQNFWDYCKAIDPKFYKEDREYLHNFADILQGVYTGTMRNEEGNEYRGILVSFPPRHGKSYTIALFASWLLGNNPDKSVIDVSYNIPLASKASKITREIVLQKPTPDTITFTDIFPGVSLKSGDASILSWALDKNGRKQGDFAYMATGLDGSVTGYGARGLLIIDDPVKNAAEAFNKSRLDAIYDTYTNTFFSRIEKGAKELIIQTRWSKDDLIGRILSSPIGKEYYVVRYQAYNPDTDSMLCDDILNKQDYLAKKAITDEGIFLANYQQQTIDKKGVLYPDIDQNKYDGEIEDNGRRFCYVDPSFTGNDYFAAIVGQVMQDKIYILDLMYNQNYGHYEDELLQLLIKNNVKEVMIESNSGGMIFADNIKKRIKNDYNNQIIVSTKHQSKNKETRLITYAPFILRDVLWPKMIKMTHSEAWEHIINFSRIKNAHDDIEDALTGFYETFYQVGTGGFTFVDMYD